jgi:hypothetical protein
MSGVPALQPLNVRVVLLDDEVGTTPPCQLAAVLKSPVRAEGDHVKSGEVSAQSLVPAKSRPKNPARAG